MYPMYSYVLIIDEKKSMWRQHNYASEKLNKSSKNKSTLIVLGFQKIKAHLVRGVYPLRFCKKNQHMVGICFDPKRPMTPPGSIGS